MPGTQENTKDFAALYDQCVRPIFNFIYYKTLHKETAEDLTAETFLKAFKKFDTFDERKGKFSTWLYQIARNTVIDFYKLKKNYLNIDDIWDLSDDKDILQDIENIQRLEKVKSYLKKLDKDQREIIILRVWNDLPYKEIALILGRNEADCRMLFSRAIKQLRDQMPLLLLLSLLLS